MGKTSKETSTTTESMAGYEGRFTEIGDMTVAYETYTADADLKNLFTGLPGDMRQAAHYGYVITGKVAFRYADGTLEEITTGSPTWPPPATPPSSTPGPSWWSSPTPSN